MNATGYARWFRVLKPGNGISLFFGGVWLNHSLAAVFVSPEAKHQQNRTISCSKLHAGWRCMGFASIRPRIGRGRGSAWLWHTRAFWYFRSVVSVCRSALNTHVWWNECNVLYHRKITILNHRRVTQRLTPSTGRKCVNWASRENASSSSCGLIWTWAPRTSW